MQTKALSSRRPWANLSFCFPGLSFPIYKKGKCRAVLVQIFFPARLTLRGPHPRGSHEVRAREDSSPGVSASGTGGPGAHAWVRSPSTPSARESTRPGRRGVQVQQARDATRGAGDTAGAGRGSLT